MSKIKFFNCSFSFKANIQSVETDVRLPLVKCEQYLIFNWPEWHSNEFVTVNSLILASVSKSIFPCWHYFHWTYLLWFFIWDRLKVLQQLIFWSSFDKIFHNASDDKEGIESLPDVNSTKNISSRLKYSNFQSTRLLKYLPFAVIECQEIWCLLKKYLYQRSEISAFQIVGKKFFAWRLKFRVQCQLFLAENELKFQLIWGEILCFSKWLFTCS